MARSRSLENRLERLSELEKAPYSDTVRDELRRSLEDKSNRVVGKAAKMIANLELTELIDKLRSTWPRFLESPLEGDKGCVAKTAIAEALAQLGHDDPDFFLAGIVYRQIEPNWPMAEDTAINLRGTCGFALARSRMISVHDKLIALTELLADHERLARIHAVNALADTGQDAVIPLLRLKAQCGDSDADVTGACFCALLNRSPEESVPFVARFLKTHDEAVFCEAAAALGECGQPAAIDILIATWERVGNRELQESLLVSLGLSRQPAAVDFLISLLAPSTHSSEQALRALAPSRFYSDVRERVQAAVELTGNCRLQVLFEEMYPNS